MMWVLFILLGIICGAITYVICDTLSVKSIIGKLHFTDEQEKIKRQLIEKKNIAKKEMTDEIQRSIDEKQKQLNKLNLDYQRKADEYTENTLRLDRDFQRTREAYEQMDKEAEAERQKENAELIAAATKDREMKIASITTEYEKEKERVKENFQTFSDEINLKKAALTEEIKAFEHRQAAIIEQFKKDEEVRKQRDFYHITINSAYKSDIAKLKQMAPGFSRPELFYKLLYDTYYKPPIEELFKRVLGDNKDKGGIYKITNINNEKVYIGKSVKFIDRWRIHAKRGCNIERISGQIYEAMFDEGLENFSFEIVEICSKDQQTEREKYWIDFYKSNQWGYNIRNG